MGQDSQVAIAKLIDSSIEQIIEWASIEPDKVIQEFHARRATRTDGQAIETVADLQEARLGDANRVARGFVETYSQMSAGQGFVTGLGGLVTLRASLPVDVAAYLGWLARTASAVQLCYGFEDRADTADAQIKLAMHAGAGVSRLTLQGTEILVTQLGNES